MDSFRLDDDFKAQVIIESDAYSVCIEYPDGMKTTISGFPNSGQAELFIGIGDFRKTENNQFLQAVKPAYQLSWSTVII